MKKEWVSHCLELAHQEPDLYSGSRKILRNVQLSFPIECTLTLEDAGYTRNKMRQLERNYLHPESIRAAVELWQRYRDRPKYRSVSFTCYNHFVKDHHGPRGSVMGPCMQSVVVTMLDARTAEVTVLYRTTEVFKKFPADLVFLTSRLLTDFNFEGMTVLPLQCFFINLTVHPAYFVTIIPYVDDVVKELEQLRRLDKYFFDWCVKWTARYTIPKYGHGIAKFAQALRIKDFADERIQGALRDKLNDYLERHHPGYTHTRFTDDDE